MNAKARAARRFIKASSAATRAARKAAKAVKTGAPQPAKTHLIAKGLDMATAKRFAGAFSKGVVPTATGETKVKLKGRRTKRVAVKLYDAVTFAGRLAIYRPKDKTAAALFTRIAAV